MDLILEDESLEGFKNRLAHLKHLAFIDLKAIKKAYEPAIREIGLNPWDNFTDENKVQLAMIKFLSLEERFSESQPSSQKNDHSKSVMIDSLVEKFEQIRFDSQQQIDRIEQPGYMPGIGASSTDFMGAICRGLDVPISLALSLAGLLLWRS